MEPNLGDYADGTLQVEETGALCRFLEQFLSLLELIYSPNFDYCPIGESNPSNIRRSEELGPSVPLIRPSFEYIAHLEKSSKVNQKVWTFVLTYLYF